MVKTFGEVANYWLSDPTRAVELQSALGRAYLDLWGAAVKRLSGEESDPVVAPDPKDRRFADPEWSSNQFFDFVKQAYLLSTNWADHLVEGAKDLDPHTRQKAEFYVTQVANALSPSNFVLTNPELLRETIASNAENLARGMHMLAEDIEAGGGDLKIRQSDCRQVRGRPQPRGHARQGDLRKRADAAHPVRAVDAERAEDAAADLPALDQQVLRARSDAGEILHQVVRRSGPHRVRDLLGQSRTRSSRDKGFEDYMRRGPARRHRRHRDGHRRGQGPHHRLLRRRHAAFDHARLHGGEERPPRRLRHAVRRASRFHPRRRSQGVRRRGAARCAGEAHGRARLSRRQEDGQRLQHAALQRPDLALHHQQLPARQGADAVRPAVLEFGRDADAGRQPRLLSAPVLSQQHAVPGQDDDRQRPARSQAR